MLFKRRQFLLLRTITPSVFQLRFTSKLRWEVLFNWALEKKSFHARNPNVHVFCETQVADQENGSGCS